MNALPIRLVVKRFGDHTLPLPRHQTDGAAGIDLCYAGPTRTLAPGELARLPVGFGFEIPEGYEGQVRGRSGYNGRGLFVPTGTIDSDYRGEVVVFLFAALPADSCYGLHIIAHGDRIAQLVIAPVRRVYCEEGALSDTARGSGGFGSTGT